MAESNRAVFGAIAANVAIAVTKFIVAGTTGSSAMLSEAIHSLVDTCNGLLLLVGLRRSRRRPTPEHPFGHGRELYYWSLIVAVLIFGLGGGMSIYEGLRHIRHPEPLADPTWNYVVLAAAMLFEGISFTIAWQEFRRESAGRPLLAAMCGSKDPTTYTVLAEDGAALAGLAIAATGIWASHRFDAPLLDGVASVLIGALLAGVALLLIRKARGLLVGEGVGTDTAAQIKKIALAHAGVRATGPALTMYLGADEVLLTLDLLFEPGVSTAQLVETCAGIEREIRSTFDRRWRIYLGVHIESEAPAAARLGTPLVGEREARGAPAS